MRRLSLALMLAVSALTPRPGHATPEPRATREVRVDPKVGTALPRGLVFVTPDGQPAPLGSYLRNDMPVLLMFAYARCRSLCNVVLQSATQAIREMSDWQPGKDYQPLLIGLDPEQPLDEARRHQATLLERIGKPGEPQAFPYLLGKQPQIDALADSVGFRYAWDERSEQYAHPAVFMIIDEHGRVAQYLHALGTGKQELSAALSAARGDGPAAPLTNSLAGDLLRCFRFDPALRTHREAITLYFRIGGAVIFAALCSLVLGLLAWERRRRA